MRDDNTNVMYVQSSWRSYRVRRAAMREERDAWRRVYGQLGELARVDDVADGRLLRSLVFFVDAGEWQDVVALARVCYLCCMEVGCVDGNGDACTREEEDGSKKKTMTAIQNFVINRGGVVSARKLLRLAIASLAIHSQCFREHLMGPFAVHSGGQSQDDMEDDDAQVERCFHAMMHYCMSVVSSQFWRDVVDSGTINLVQKQMLLPATWFGSDAGGGRSIELFQGVGRIVETGCEVSNKARATSAAEMLATNLIVCFASIAGEEGYAVTGQKIMPLMGVPKLFDRCQSLRPLAGRLWKMTMKELETEFQLDFDKEFADFDGEVLVQGRCRDLADSKGFLVENLLNGLAIGITSKSSGNLVNMCVCFMIFLDTSLRRLQNEGVDIKTHLWRLVEPETMHSLLRPLWTLENSKAEGSMWPHKNFGASKIIYACHFIGTLLKNRPDQSFHSKLLLTLAIRTDFVALVWHKYLKPDRDVSVMSLNLPHTWMKPMKIMCDVFLSALIVLGDDGLYERGLPLPLKEVFSPKAPRCGLLAVLKSTIWSILWKHKGGIDSSLDERARMSFILSAGRVIGSLNDRNGRREFAPPDAFYADDLPLEHFHASAAASIERKELNSMHGHLSTAIDDIDDEDGSYTEVPHLGNKVLEVLLYAPSLVPFIERVRIFQSLVSNERSSIRDDSHPFTFFDGLGPTSDRFITVHRGRVLEDAYEKIGQNKNQDVRKRIRISFVNEFGENEAGVDGGGVFKEFLENVIREASDPSLGLFQATTDHRLYPAPARLPQDAARLAKLEFVGTMIGKALWEGILLELPFASFFLKKFRATRCGVDDLPTLDPELAKNLKYLLKNPGDVDKLDITFTLTTEYKGISEDVELVPGGSNIKVDASNAAQFVQRVADYKLNKEIKLSCNYFLRGFHSVIPVEWVASFNDMELQMLIGGAEGKGIDLQDMSLHVQYSGGYTASHPVIMNFWKALSTFSSLEKASFLRFVTSCPRPPLLGFGSLEPPLTIQMAGNEEQEGAAQGTERLPTSATCINLLKLPPYSGTYEKLRSKLLYAIQANAGFDLS